MMITKVHGLVLDMKTFTFENHLGETFTAKSENGLDVIDDANEALLQSNHSEGVWQQVSDTEFKWALGNFIH